MAKRRKEKDEEVEDKGFKVPKFDEEAFLKRERRNIKATFIAFLFGLLMALICFGFWALMGNTVDLRWTLVILVCIANAIFIRNIFQRINLDLTEFTRKNWFVVIMVYFFTWLLVFIVLVNPPFYDDENPRVNLAVLPEIQEPGGSVMFVAKISDNAGVEKSEITFKINDTIVDNNNFEFQNNIFNYTFEAPDNGTEDITYNYVLEVQDVNGLTDIKQGSFEYTTSAIGIASHEGAKTKPGPEVSFGSSINFEIKSDIARAYYTVNDGPKINFNLTKQDGYYRTFPKYEGWPKNENVTVKVYAEAAHYFEFIFTGMETEIDPEKLKEYNNTIVDTAEYYFQTRSDGIGEEEPPEEGIPNIPFVQVPGFEVILFIIALIAVVLIFKYKKKDRRQK